MTMPATEIVKVRRDARLALALPVFAATIFLSAFLLFSVQPFFAKMVLPKLGGSPAVWSVAMVFFQTVLLLGYAWAHLITSRLPLKLAALAHLAVMAVAFVALPIAIPQGWSEPPVEGQALWLMGLFAVAVGLPFFAVSANGPLLQAWFARTGHPHAHDPYFLYGASNIGSFASLILYIVAIEPLLKVTQQSAAWTGGFALLALSIAACALIAVGGKAVEADTSKETRAEPVSWARKGRWVLLAALPSALLVAVTAHVSMDIAAAPFLWVLPLALFLLTFVIAFARRRIVQVSTLSGALPPFAAILLVSMVMSGVLPVWLVLLCHLLFFFAAALMAHMLLVDERPEASGLTGFYFWMSFGGVLGGAFTTLVSPVVFDWVAEYPLLILAALLLRPQMWAGEAREVRIVIWSAALVAVTINNPLVAGHVVGLRSGFLALAVAGFALVAPLVRYRSEALHAGFALLAVGLLFVCNSGAGSLGQERSFFGVVRAFVTPDGRFNVMAHGTTEHGSMRVAERGSKPTPLAYYHESGGIARALFAAQGKTQADGMQVGIVGLGAGAMLCHRRQGERWFSYEIDRAVVDLAANPAIFSFVPVCGNGDPIVIGDARLTLAKEPDGKFDYLLIDAFSSDSIPVHLLTAEAMRLYRSKLAQGGIIAIHISNRYMELRSVVAALAAETRLVARAGVFSPPAHLANGERINRSEVVALAASEADFGAILEDPDWKPAEAGSTAAWTDDYSNVIAAILRKF